MPSPEMRPATVTHGLTLKAATGTANTDGDNELVAAVSGERIKVYGYALTMNSTTATNVVFESSTSGIDLATFVFQAGTDVTTGANLACTPPGFLMATDSGESLNMRLDQTVTFSYAIFYWTEV